MIDNLYFIPLIVQALQEQDVRAALRATFCAIKMKGTEERYAEGFRNFELFMDAMHSRFEMMTTHNMREQMVELAAGTFAGTAQELNFLLRIIKSHPKWQVEYETMCRQEIDELAQSFPVIHVLSERGLLGEMAFTKVPSRECCAGILPGSYRLKLANTGWNIWEGELTATELIWTKALPMAAGEAEIPPSSEIVLLDGDLILRTYAGIESGSIEIELTR